jgi:ABC-type transporter Mla subunit MlaD
MDPIKQAPSSDLGGGFSQARRDVGESLGNASESASKMVSGAKASVAEFASNAADSFKSSVEDQKTAGAGAIGDLARAAKSAADDFQDRAPEIANTVRTVANRVEGVSNDIRDRSVNELMNSVTDFAAQKPMAFFGCGILAGFVISRLLSTSNR